MALDGTVDVRHASWRHLQRVSVEDFPELMVIGKVFINQQEELLGNIRLYTLAERRIEPGYLTFPLLTLRAAAITVGKRCIEATTFQGVFVQRFGFVECRFIAGNALQPPLHHFWDMLQDGGWVVARRIDVYRCVVRFPIRFVCTVGQVERDI